MPANNWEAKFDVYTPTTPGPHPVVLHIHGGGLPPILTIHGDADPTVRFPAASTATFHVRTENYEGL